jgi:hypothetical protein
MMAVSFVALGGMLGLAIDVGIAYFIKARLSQAVDAASLAGARSLARGSNGPDQATNALAVADKYFAANFPAGFWGCTTQIDPTNWVDPGDTNSKIRKLYYRASATMPLYFLRLLGKTTATVSGFAIAQRRDANIMIVLDRSGSMNSAVGDLVTSAKWFVSQFAVGRDKVGLVTFGGTYNLIKPTVNFTSDPTNLPAAISKLTASTVAGTTNHSQPLWVAYQALAEPPAPTYTNESAALNVIVFFTDGQPNTITADFYNIRQNKTSCDQNGKSMIGYALGENTTGFFGTSLIPPYEPLSVGGVVARSSATTKPSAYISDPYDLKDSCTSKGNPSSYCTADERISVGTTNYSGCKFVSSAGSFFQDISQVPTTDYYGNQTNPAKAYKSVTYGTKTGANLMNAAFNAADHAAQRMRSGELGDSITPLVDCIALNTGSAIDSVYMKRLANVNDPSNTIYDKAKPTGLYVYATSPADLQPAFVQIASQILHLAQ